MSDIFIWSEIEELRKKIKEYDLAYYRDSNSKISDYEYDQLFKKLKDLEKQYPEFKESDSPTEKITSDISNEKSAVIPHKKRMYSLGNTYSMEELKAALNRISKENDSVLPELICELKIDGFSINLYYEDGNLIYASTRGDGFEGEDVTQNIKELKSIPQKINFKGKIEIRGEIFLPIAAFEKINKLREKNGETLFANPRNVAAGSIKLKDSKLFAERNLTATMYTIGIAEGINIKSQEELFEFLKNNGFSISNFSQKVNSFEEIKNYCDKWEKQRSELSFEIDGVVIKVNSFELQEKIGYTAKNPKWAFAYKFKAEEKYTKLLGATFQVGRTGAITPVAHLQPVFISGSTVSRATLHNSDEIKRLDLHLNDTVKIIKSGEIIPKIIEVDKTKRVPNSEKVRFPKVCPSCGSVLEREPEGVIYYCNNINCPAQLKRKVEHFVSRDTMDIDGLGESLVSKLIDKKLIEKIEDIYNLDYQKIVSLDKLAEKSVENLKIAIEKSKNQPLHKVLFGLGIRFVGAKTSKILADYFKSIDRIKNATYEELLDIEEIGEKIAESVVNFFKSETNIQTLEKLKEVGVKFEYIESEKTKISGKTFLITGTLKNYKRNEIKNMIERLGGKILSSVSKNLDFLIVGEKPGSKLSKAQKIPSIKIINEEEFKELVD